MPAVWVSVAHYALTISLVKMSRWLDEPKAITCNSIPTNLTRMSELSIENTVVDEANQRTYIVVAPRVLSDGEVYSAIRRELLKRGGLAPAPGETLTINMAATLRDSS